MGHDSGGSVELPAVGPDAGLAAELLGGFGRALAGYDAPPIGFEAEVFDRDGLGCLASLSDAMQLRVRVLEFRQKLLSPCRPSLCEDSIYQFYSQGTREGCILSPLLFIIFFSDAVEAMENVQLDNGSIKLGSLLIPQA